MTAVDTGRLGYHPEIYITGSDERVVSLPGSVRQVIDAGGRLGEILDRPAIEIAEQIRSRAVSSSEVVGAFLQRIERVNPQINAVVQIAPDGLERAKNADAALARGEIVGPLHGVPFTVKDIFDTAGIISAAGITDRATFVPEHDAVVVARMRAAGAILIGKTNCPPGGGGGVTDNPVYGRTNNPYGLDRTTAGSSGGEAAIQAAGGSPLGIGSDSGGSLRLPAHYCGIATIKPTTGRVPNTGAFQLPGGLSDTRSQIGPMSRFVADLGPTLAVIAGPDWRDSGVVPVPLGREEDVHVTGLRVAWYDDDGDVTPTTATKETVRATTQALADAGATVEPTRPPALRDALSITQGYWGMSDLKGNEVEALFERWDAFRSDMLQFMTRYDVILCPVDQHPAPCHDAADPHRFAYTLAFSLCGLPCAVVRAGTSDDGMPIGVQIVARPWDDHVALAVARQVELFSGGWQPPPL
jgi:amidase